MKKANELRITADQSIAEIARACRKRKTDWERIGFPLFSENNPPGGKPQQHPLGSH